MAAPICKREIHLRDRPPSNPVKENDPVDMQVTVRIHKANYKCALRLLDK